MTKRYEDPEWITRNYVLDHRPMDPQPLRLYGTLGSRTVKRQGNTWIITHKTRRI